MACTSKIGDARGWPWLLAVAAAALVLPLLAARRAEAPAARTVLRTGDKIYAYRINEPIRIWSSAQCRPAGPDDHECRGHREPEFHRQDVRRRLAGRRVPLCRQPLGRGGCQRQPGLCLHRSLRVRAPSVAWTRSTRSTPLTKGRWAGTARASPTPAGRRSRRRRSTRIRSTARTTTATARSTRTTRRSPSRCSPASTGTTPRRRGNRYPEHRPLNLRIHQESYAWSTEGANEFVGFDFKIVNDGFELLRQVYLGFFVDSDVGPKERPGYYTDDRGAFYATDTTFVDPTITYVCTQRAGRVKKRLRRAELRLEHLLHVRRSRTTARSPMAATSTGYFGGMFLGHTTDPFGERAPARVEVHTARFFNGATPIPPATRATTPSATTCCSRGRMPTRPTGSPDDYRYCFSAGPVRRAGARRESCSSRWPSSSGRARTGC